MYFEERTHVVEGCRSRVQCGVVLARCDGCDSSAGHEGGDGGDEDKGGRELHLEEWFCICGMEESVFSCERGYIVAL